MARLNGSGWQCHGSADWLAVSARLTRTCIMMLKQRNGLSDPTSRQMGVDARPAIGQGPAWKQGTGGRPAGARAGRSMLLPAV